LKTALKGKRFQDAEALKKNVTTELNALLLEAFADCFQKLVFKQTEINLNINKKCFIFLYIILLFSRQSGNFIANLTDNVTL
jgi:hypothetical protein